MRPPLPRDPAEARLLLAMAFWVGFGFGATLSTCVANLPPHPPCHAETRR